MVIKSRINNSNNCSINCNIENDNADNDNNKKMISIMMNMIKIKETK